MAMVVKNNMSAVRTLNTLNQNTSALQKSLQKVSSGMKINSAQDDASGYAISERMRVRIRSLDQANRKAQSATPSKSSARSKKKQSTRPTTPTPTKTARRFKKKSTSSSTKSTTTLLSNSTASTSSTARRTTQALRPRPSCSTRVWTRAPKSPVR